MSNLELNHVTELLSEIGFILAKEQPHIQGERFLMQAMTTIGGQKYILKGSYRGNEVIIKITKDENGKKEIEHERLCRSLINQLNFAYEIFSVPEEIFYQTKAEYLINAQKFIPQAVSFLERPLIEQFDFALRAFEAQEYSRATTSRHIFNIEKTFGLMKTVDYIHLFESFVTKNAHDLPTKEIIKNACSIFCENKVRIEQYKNFLTHTDFVPHNFRIFGNKLYLLDFSAIRFGNKHESWARFLNFMTLYNPDLETVFLKFFTENRSLEEQESLYLMRLFRLSELITYYRSTLSKSTGNLLMLNSARIEFWKDVLVSTLNKERLSNVRRQEYINLRDQLRSNEEKKRQIGLH
jgi:hypothetical protein